MLSDNGMVVSRANNDSANKIDQENKEKQENMNKERDIDDGNVGCNIGDSEGDMKHLNKSQDGDKIIDFGEGDGSINDLEGIDKQLVTNEEKVGENTSLSTNGGVSDVNKTEVCIKDDIARESDNTKTNTLDEKYTGPDESQELIINNEDITGGKGEIDVDDNNKAPADNMNNIENDNLNNTSCHGSDSEDSTEKVEYNKDNTQSDDELDREYDSRMKELDGEDEEFDDDFDMNHMRERKLSSEEANRGFDNDEVAEYKEVFEYFDKAKKGYITSKQMATTLRALKPIPDEYLVTAKVEEIDKEMKGRLNFQQYLDVLHYIIRKAKQKKRKRSCYTNLSEKQMGEIRDAFTMFDHDGDGTISAGELKSVMMNIGVYSTDEDVNDMVKELDADDSGSLDFPEFVSLMTRKISGAEVTNEMLEAFRYFDKDGDGTISASEVRTVMDALGEDLSDVEIEEMIREADRKGKGGVTYEDFVKMVASQ